MKSILLAGCLLLVSAGTSSAQTNPAPGSLTVNVTGFRNSKGACKLWLFTAARRVPVRRQKSPPLRRNADYGIDQPVRVRQSARR